MKEPVIISAVRTPLGKFNGTLKNMPATKLGSLVIEECVKRAGIAKEDVDEVIMGMVLQAGIGQNPARQAALSAGIPENKGAMTINKVCGSGLKSIMIAANSIKVGEHDIIVAGGMENMAQAPYYLHKARDGYRMGDGKIVDGMVYDGLWEVYNDFHVGITGERIAEHYDLTREEVDAFAVRSHRLAAAARESGKFVEEIIKIEIPQRRGDPIIFDSDEGIRADSSVEKLARLRAVFKKDGLVTAGNASQISDGASAVLVTSREKAVELGIPILAKIIDYHTSGCAPEDVMEAPVPTMREIMERNNLTIEDLDLIEHNEAFASASLAIQKEFDIPEDKFNVHGGGVALGHPIGASGARVLTTLIYAMKDRGAKRGLATLCLGGGNAVAMIIEI
ncbi:MAG: acetyl-CoA C-acetyltransferase [Candidatus Thermoplasmatota archaeon]|jgi:acetyl-CoA C-acetyltransferase|nr:acetyl-CoA C-acetyltransferase [Candidatus Thermoplasmatota archaeon]